MKTAIIYTIIGLLAINSLTAQVKIGDNPQNLNPASLLELESTSRALVITRVTDAQMSSISPLRGALVYNTDQNCLHYYDGTAWINICEALDDSFTTSTEDGTIVITQDGDNYDFSVGIIDGTNIRNFSIGAIDIQGGAIDTQHYSPNSINIEDHLNYWDQGTRQIILWNGNEGTNGEWQRIAESDLQISENQDLADVVANDPSAGNSVISDVLNPVDPLDVVNLQSLNAAITASELMDEDKDDENELQSLSLTTNQLSISNDPTASPVNLAGYLDNTDEQDLVLTGNILTLTGDPTPTPIDLSSYANDDTNELQSLSLSGDQLSISNDPTASPVNLAGYLDNTDEQDLVLTGNILTLTGDPTPTPIDLSSYANDDNNELQSLNLSGDQLSISNDPTASPVNLVGYLDNTDEQDLDLTGDVLTLTGDPTPTPIDLSSYANDDNNELQSLSLSGNLLSISNDPTASPVDLVGYLDNTDEQDLDLTGDVLTLTGDPTPTPIDLSSYINTDEQDLSIGGGGTPNESVEVSISGGGASAIINIQDGDFNPLNETNLGFSFTGSSVELSDAAGILNITLGGITSSDLSVTNGTGATFTNVGLEIAPGAITNADINSNAAIAGTKINPDFGSQIVETTGDYLYNGASIVPDFVFEKYFNGYSNLNEDYEFKSLKEIELFIKENNHLPGIKSAYEIIENGKYGLVESSLSHLEKIEELFLHTIEQEKKIETLQSDNQKLTEEVDSLKAEMKEIKALLLKNSQN